MEVRADQATECLAEYINLRRRREIVIKDDICLTFLFLSLTAKKPAMFRLIEKETASIARENQTSRLVIYLIFLLS